jgi:hypothetical protein
MVRTHGHPMPETAEIELCIRHIGVSLAPFLRQMTYIRVDDKLLRFHCAPRIA